MLKFVNLKTGNVFEGYGDYIHWFEGQQSTDIIYSQPICVVSDSDIIKVSLKSPVFSLVDTNEFDNIENINGIDYCDINNIKRDELELRSQGSIDGNHLFIIYFLAQSPDGGEFVDNFDINGETFNIGADFYKENESLAINLLNFGVEIPESIQKAIYCSNVREEAIDNILLNRKFKELLMNYMDIIANKGSYKSLIESLKWFEYGDIIKIKEIWKREDFGKIIYSDASINMVVSDRIKDMIQNFSKTTYISLSIAKQGIVKGSYDEELNPVLKQMSFLWSQYDMMLKMSLLGNFYETYFMPIHMDLIHSTLEDIIFTNTIKECIGTAVSREDTWIDYEPIHIHIDNELLNITNVKARVDNNTLFCTKWVEGMNYNTPILGVSKDISIPNGIQTYASQYYNGLGVILDLKCNMKADIGDSIFKEILWLKDGETWIIKKDNKEYKEYNGEITINFSILITNPNQNHIKLQLHSSNGHIYTGEAKFKIYDNTTPELKLYKLKSLEPSEAHFFYGPANDYMFNRVKDIGSYTQYISGAKLNNLLVFECSTSAEFDIYKNKLLQNYIIFKKDVGGAGKKIYIIGVSKEYDFDPKQVLSTISIKPYRNDYVYIPEFHCLEEFGGDSLNDYMIDDSETLVVFPLIDEKSFKYSKNNIDIEWEFINKTNGDVIRLNSILEPYIANTTKQHLSKGYWGIKMRYDLGFGVKEVELNSAFIKI